jgi:formiminotetrahydrofolate cyclodeaminase
VDDFLDRLASGAPVPAGGSAAALTAAVSAGLVSMVCYVTARHSSGCEGIAEVKREANELRAHLTALMGDDARAFEAVLQARRAPGDQRAIVVREALRRATAIPLDVAQAAHRILGFCARIATGARLSTMSDLGVSAALAGAAFDGATLTARVNLRDLDDPAFTARTLGILDRLTGEVTELRHRVAQVVVARTGVSV